MTADDTYSSGPVLWRDLRAHAARQGLFLVHDVDLIEAARAIATDDVPTVQGWIEGGQLTRPTAEQLEAWEKCLDKPFTAAIVQPFALAKPVAGYAGGE